MSRNKNGQFAKGNSGGPGRPSRPTETAYLNVLMNACTLDDWREITMRAVSDAKDGDAKAREWLGRHVIGMPKAEAPTLMALQQLVLSGIDPAYLERARVLLQSRPFDSIKLRENKVEKEEQVARDLMEEDMDE